MQIINENKEIIINVIGGGLAGSEAVWQLARFGYQVRLFEQKPVVYSEAHSLSGLCELVCSNSLKSNAITGACGLLKEEMRRLESITITCADQTKVGAGGALAVDRDKYSQLVTEKITALENVEIIHGEITQIPTDGITIIATGPLTSGKLYENIMKLTGGDLHFFDAASPIVKFDSVDMNSAFFQDRYDKGEGDGDYLNLPMNKEEYQNFYNNLITAERADLHSFEKKEVFESCMPIEIMASRGEDTIRFGPLKPVGLRDREGNRPYAVVQMRKENANGDLYNMVGFQTNLKFGEQKRVFSMIPALKNAEFVKYGVMHRNSYINAPNLLSGGVKFKNCENLYFAGQITGVEGYVESAMSGLISAIAIHRELQGKPQIDFGNQTMIGALLHYISTENKNFQPMNANFGIVDMAEYKMIRNKQERYLKTAEKSLGIIEKIKADNEL